MSGIFMSKELEEAIMHAKHEIGGNRTREEAGMLGNILYENIKNDVERAKLTQGRDYITYVLDRKIGKTHSLIQLAFEYQYPLIVHDAMWARHIENEARKDGKKINVMSFRSASSRIIGSKCNIVLKDELVDATRLRESLDWAGVNYANIVGIN